MRIKIIQHDNMRGSIDYLYEKQDKEGNYLHPISSNFDKELFHEHVSSVINANEERTGKQLQRNNTMKHLVLTFHPDDSKLIEDKADEILAEVLNELGINDPIDFGLTAFVHQDRAHPHIHIAFTRIGLSGEKINDSNLGWKVNDIAKKIEQQFNLTVAKKQPLMNIQRTDLYKPTKRGQLLKTINYALQRSKNVEEYKKILLSHGIFPKINEKDQTITYINNTDRIAYEEKILPSQARLKNLSMAIKRHKLSKEEQQSLNDLQTAITSCRTLEEIKELFKGEKIYYNQVDDYITDIRIVTPTQTIKMDHFSLVNIKIEKDENISKFEYIQNPIIFESINQNTFETDREEQETKNRHKKAHQKGKGQSGMKVKY